MSEATPGYYNIIMWGSTEPSVGPRFDTEEERDAEIRAMLDPSHENSLNDDYDCYCRLNIDENGVPSVVPYLNSEIEEWQEANNAGET